jgi:RNA polymerase sigma factor (sigma-70 family)
MTTAITSHATRSSADLLLRIGEGDPSAWEVILHRYGTLVSTTVRSFRLQDADTLNAMQTTWLRLAENSHQVRHPERLGGWLATTARRECLRILRQTKPAPDAIGTRPETVADPSAGPEQRVTDADIAQRLWKLVDELPPARRILLRALFTDHPRSYTEVARLAGIPPGAIGPTRARTLRQLRSLLEQHELGTEARAMTPAVTRLRDIPTARPAPPHRCPRSGGRRIS